MAQEGGPRDPFVVRDLVVDETGASTRAARMAGWDRAKVTGAQRLIEKLTLPEDRVAGLNPNAVAAMNTGTRIQENERTTTTRYTAVLSVPYDAKKVRDYLDGQRVPFVDVQAGLALLAPVATGVAAAEWQAQWTSNGAPRADNTALAPYVASSLAWDKHPSWVEFETEFNNRNAQRVVIADIFYQTGGYFVRLSELRGNAAETQLGQAGPFPDMGAARLGTITELENIWKRASIVRTTGSSDIQLAVLFTDINQWVKIRKALETSRLITTKVIESVSPTGADVRLTYSGRPDQLTTDLRARGLELAEVDRRWILRAQ